MEISGSNCNPSSQNEEDMDLRRGPWTIEEDLLLINHIASNGEGRWNSLSRSAGLKRTGKSCRLRWLNYLRPDVRRGNITPEEQLLILELHSRLGNRWSKIAQHLPGRTDNEIKNYWRTRVQKHAKQLRCDVNSKKFKDTMRYLWMPRLIERIQASSGSSLANNALQQINSGEILPAGNTTSISNGFSGAQVNPVYTPEHSSTAASSETIETQVSDYYSVQVNNGNENNFQGQFGQDFYTESLISPSGYFNYGLDFQATEQNNTWLGSEDIPGNLWNMEDIWFSQQLL